jgi:hypothetical protein
VVVVHLYEPAVQVRSIIFSAERSPNRICELLRQGCVRMNSMLEQLAATMPGLKFLRLQVCRISLVLLTICRCYLFCTW